jgi:DNA-binding LacI/PurR family transcriptional regulator/DNA-binding transcriptional regulator YhcF (GntR family)
MNSIEHTFSMIKDKLASGYWQQGSRLPSLKNLARMCSVSRTTMWRALGMLKKESLVLVRHRGTIIAGSTMAVPVEPHHDGLLWQQVQKRIGQDILAGAYQSESLPPLSKLARRYGVAMRTLKKAIAGLIHEKVLIADGRKLRQPGHTLPAYRSTVVFISYGDSEKGIRFGDPRIPLLVDSFERECSRLGFSPKLLAFNQYDPNSFLRIREAISQIKHPAGFVANLWNPWIESLYKRWRDVFYFLVNQKVPISVFDQSGNLAFPGDLLGKSNFHVLRIAGEKAGEMVAQTLLMQGHRQFAFITPYFNQHWVQHRYQGLRRYVQQYGKLKATVELYALHELTDQTDLTLAALGLGPKAMAALYKGLLSPDEVHGLLDRFNQEKWLNLASGMRHAPGMEIIRKTARFLSTLSDRSKNPSHFNHLMEALQYIASNQSIEAYLQPFFQGLFKKTSATAWVCSDDKTALTAVTFLRSMGKRVPEDVSVFGFDNWRAAAEEGLSTYDFNMNGMIQQALMMILDDKILKSTRAISEVDGYVVERTTSASPVVSQVKGKHES